MAHRGGESSNQLFDTLVEFSAETLTRIQSGATVGFNSIVALKASP